VVYGIDEENAIVKEYHGNKDYLLTDRIYLLRIEAPCGGAFLRNEAETKSHYVYIKHIQRLLHKNTHVSGANKEMCPFCEKVICCDDFENAILKNVIEKLPRKEH
jgi:hypothetical protein